MATPSLVAVNFENGVPVIVGVVDAIEQFRDIAFDHFSDFRHPPGAEPVDAFFRFLKLLEPPRALPSVVCLIFLNTPRPHAFADERD
jgi:hypothetical protein